MSSLKARLAEKKILIVPGAYDALSAKIAARAGAEAVYMTGFGIAGSAFGVPDIGLVSANEMAERVRALASAAAPVPLIADGDNGYGGPANVARLVAAYEQAGAACIQLEDQASPKRCGHMEGKEIVPRAEAVAKIRAAVAARNAKDFLVMARTDSRAADGLDEALARGDAFLSAGADILFVEAPLSVAEFEAIGKRFSGAPLVANLVEDGKSPRLAPSDLRAMGFSIVLYPISSLLAATKTLENTYRGLLAGQSPEHRATFAEYNEIVGLSKWRSIDRGGA